MSKKQAPAKAVHYFTGRDAVTAGYKTACGIEAPRADCTNGPQYVTCRYCKPAVRKLVKAARELAQYQGVTRRAKPVVRLLERILKLTRPMRRPATDRLDEIADRVSAELKEIEANGNA